MSISFFQLMEVMKESEQHSTDKSVEAVRAGMNIRPDFWDDFIQLCGNSDGLSELLDIPRHKISAWSSKIMAALDHIKQADDGDAAHNKAQTIPTGEPE